MSRRNKTETETNDTNGTSDVVVGSVDAPETTDRMAAARAARASQGSRRTGDWSWYIAAVGEGPHDVELILACKSRRGAVRQLRAFGRIPAFRGRNLLPVRVRVYQV